MAWRVIAGVFVTSTGAIVQTRILFVGRGAVYVEKMYKANPLKLFTRVSCLLIAHVILSVAK